MNQELTFFQRHEFLIRRLHSLSGLVPVGAYMVIHLFANATILNGTEAFQNVVYQIHSLGNALLLVEWLFIFLPLIFHAVFGVVIIVGGRNNVSQYPLVKNYRYTLQRITGIIAMLFIFYHVMHLNGLVHTESYREVAGQVGIGQFRPYNAASSAARALQGSVLVPLWYAVGVLACVYHLANGLWTMGITWGVWTTPDSQRRASFVCMGFGAVLAVVGLSALIAFLRVDVDAADQREREIYQQRVDDGSVLPNDHKVYHPESDADSNSDNP